LGGKRNSRHSIRAKSSKPVWCMVYCRYRRIDRVCGCRIVLRAEISRKRARKVSRAACRRRASIMFPSNNNNTGCSRSPDRASMRGTGQVLETPVASAEAGISGAGRCLNRAAALRWAVRPGMEQLQRVTAGADSASPFMERRARAVRELLRQRPDRLKEHSSVSRVRDPKPQRRNMVIPGRTLEMAAETAAASRCVLVRP
jgi:hypothetical protein